MICIEQFNPECIYGKTIYIAGADGYQVPFSVGLIALNESPLGFKVEKYDLETQELYQIAFLVVHPSKIPNF